MKEGIELYPFPTIYSSALSMILVEFGVAGLGVYAMIGSKIFSESGYFMDAGEDAVMLLKRACGMSLNDDTVERVIKACVKREIFDKDKYERYGILTSEKVQRDYLIAVRRRKKLELLGNYILGKSLEDIVDLMKEKEDKIIKINFLKDNGERDEAVERVKEVLQKVKCKVSEKRKNVEESGEDSGNVSGKAKNVDKEDECVDKLPSNLDRVEKSREEYRIEDKSRFSKKVFFERENRIGENISGGENLSQKEQLKLNKNQINLKSYDECGESALNGEGVCCCEVLDNNGKVNGLGIDADYSIIVQDKGQVSGSEFSEIVKSGGYRKLSNEEVIMFNEEFAGKHIKEANYIVSEGFDMGAFIEEIKRSDFLTQLPNLSFDWLVKHYGVVMNGNYRKFKKKAEEEKFDMNAYLDSL